jgi:hypothetical protein
MEHMKKTNSTKFINHCSNVKQHYV